MIQRIQTVYLFVALLLIVAMFFTYSVHLITPDGNIFMLNLTGYYTDIDGEKIMDQQQYGLSFMGGVMSLLTAITIALYKKRVIQMRFCLYNIVFGIGLSGIMAMQIISNRNAMSAELFMQVPIVFPAIFAILSWLAFRAIRQDHLLVTSMDRLRSYKKKRP